MIIGIKIVALLLTIVLFALETRYYMHMFQLNSYKNKVQKAWMKKNPKNKWKTYVWIFEGFCLVLACQSMASESMVAFFGISLVLAILEYKKLGKEKAKKALVYTPRVKRMFMTLGLLFVVIGIAGFVISSLISLEVVWLFLILAIIFSSKLLLLTNVLNAPIEKNINQGFINEAKKMLSSCPNLTVIGITGSYGKTSVKYYLSTLLQSKFHTLITPESYNTPMGVVKTIRGSLKPTHEIFVCEMGAKNIGDIKELCDIVHPKHGMITSVGPQHLESFLSIENVSKTKFELAEAVGTDGYLFLNGDNGYIKEYNTNKEAIFYTTGKDGTGYRADKISVSSLGTTFTVVTPKGETAEFQTKLVGQHNVVNIVGAIAVANTLGISLEELKIPVRRLQPVEHRLQLIDRGNITIIDDAYNSNPIGSKAALDTLSLFEGERILVTPGMIELGEKEEEYNYEFGKYAATHCDYIALVGKKQTEPIARGVRDGGFPEERLFIGENLQESINYAYGIQTEKKKFILLENDLPDNY